MADCVFENVESTLPIEVFQLTKLFNACRSPFKVNLAVEGCRDENGKPWVLPIVRVAEVQMANDRTLNHEYLPVAGMPDFRKAAAELMLGSSHKVILENKVEGFQAMGGTGALRLAATFLKNVMNFDTVYVPQPTWENHIGVFRSAGFSHIREYRYLNSETMGLNFYGMCENLLAAPAKSVIILHAVAHNPTGIDLTKDQWKQICAICKENHLFVLMDSGYQGLASGSLDEDAWAPRYFADQDMDMFIAQSFSKNFGLYNERVGNLIVVSKNKKKLPDILSQMEIQIRVLWSNPANHGARIVATILNNKILHQDWEDQVMAMARRIKQMRYDLVNKLKMLGTPGTWEHIVEQNGMYSYTGLTEKQVRHMKERYIFLLRSGHMNVAGITQKNIGYVARIIDEAVRAYPRTKKYFLEFAKRKLGQMEYNVIKTPVVVDGIIMTEDAAVEVDKIESVESFVKVKVVGSLSSLSTFEMESSVHSLCTVDGIEQLEDEYAGQAEDEEEEEEDALKEVLSTSTQAGTQRSSVKTFKTRSMQTLLANEIEDLYRPKAIPARFEGTMLTPVYFDGLMYTPEKLDHLFIEAAKKGDSSIPVKFQGGMLTAAFKTMAENLNLGFGTEPVNVKFHGRLQGLIDSEAGLPVAFDGSMTAKPKTGRSKN